MFALFAVIAFALGAVLDAMHIAVPGWVLYLGLALLATHFVYTVAIPFRRSP